MLSKEAKIFKSSFPGCEIKEEIDGNERVVWIYWQTLNGLLKIDIRPDRIDDIEKFTKTLSERMSVLVSIDQEFS